jgi:hypothetical protein
MPANIDRPCRLALLLLACAAGCSGASGARVSGAVHLDGKPLQGAAVHFWPREDLDLGVYQGKTGPDGRFQLKGRFGPEVKPGRYVVLLFLDVKKDGTLPRDDDDWKELAVPGALRNTLPPRYSDKANPPFTVEVKDGDNVLEPFQLSSQPDRR